jgi:hypothetical protein
VASDLWAISSQLQQGRTAETTISVGQDRRARQRIALRHSQITPGFEIVAATRSERAWYARPIKEGDCLSGKELVGHLRSRDMKHV